MAGNRNVCRVLMLNPKIYIDKIFMECNKVRLYLLIVKWVLWGGFNTMTPY